MSENYNQVLSILVVEDDPGDFGLVRAYARLAGLVPGGEKDTLRWAKTLLEGLSESGSSKPDIVLLDLSLPDSSGISTVQAMRSALPGVPLVVLTGQDDNELADAALQAGAQDYLVKGQFENDALKRAVRHAILRNKLELERNLANEFLRKLSLAVEQSFSSIVITNLEANIEYVNRAFIKVTGYSFKEAVGQNPRILKSGKTPQATYDDLWACLKRGKMWKGEFINRAKDGREFTELSMISPVHQSDGTITHYIAIKDDITERKKAEEKVRELLAEKELILKEVHHRIKNNMSSIASLLFLQADKLTNPEAVAALKDSQARVQSMMVLYDKLYRSHSFMEIPFKEYLTNLVAEIVANFANSDLVKVETHIEDFVINTKVLSALGIIVNEIITNAMKYAFSGRNEGLLYVSASIKDKRVTLIIEDNGIGIPEAINVKSATGFGLELISMLTKQLRGSIKVEPAAQALPSGQDVDTTPSMAGGSTKAMPSGQDVDTTPSMAGGTRFILEFEM